MIDKLAENGGNLGKAIRATGLYSESVAETPTKITDSQTWNELMEFYLTDEDLTKKHKELLNAVNLEKLSFNPNDTNEEISRIIEQMEGYKLLYVKETINKEGEVTDKYAYVKAPDSMAQDKALDKAYKLKKRYAESDVEKPKENVYNFFFEPKFQQNIRNYDENLKKQILNAQQNKTTQTPLDSE